MGKRLSKKKSHRQRAGSIDQEMSPQSNRYELLFLCSWCGCEVWMVCLLCHYGMSADLIPWSCSLIYPVMVCHGDAYGVMTFASFRLRATNMQCKLLCSSRTLDVQDVQESIDLAASFFGEAASSVLIHVTVFDPRNCPSRFAGCVLNKWDCACRNQDNIQLGSLIYVHYRFAVLPRIGFSGLGYDLPSNCHSPYKDRCSWMSKGFHPQGKKFVLCCSSLLYSSLAPL